MSVSTAAAGLIAWTLQMTLLLGLGLLLPALFMPATLQGKPVAVYYRLTFLFPKE